MAQPKTDKQPEAPPRRRGWVGDVGNDAGFAARAAFTRAGFADPTLVLRWNEIAGAETARLCRPIKLAESAGGGVLTLKAEPAAALFLQHETRVLCARINSYLGRVAVSKLKFVQGPLIAPLPPPHKLPPPADPGPDDPARRWKGASALGESLLGLARQRTRARRTD
jgi:hypothetical protein